MRAWSLAVAALTLAHAARAADLPRVELPAAALEAPVAPSAGAAAVAASLSAPLSAVAPQAASAAPEGAAPDAVVRTASAAGSLFDGSAAARAGYDEAYEDLALLAPAAAAIEKEHVDAVDRSRLYHSALKALLRESGRAHDPENGRRFAALRAAARLRRQPVGLDAERLIDGSILVRGVEPGQGADAAGLRPGDRLIIVEDAAAPVREVRAEGRVVHAARGRRFADLSPEEAKRAIRDAVSGGEPLIALRKTGAGEEAVRLEGRGYDAKAVTLLAETLQETAGARPRAAAEAALRGFSAPLDRHTIVIPRRETDEVRRMFESRYTGVGVVLRQSETSVTIDEVRAGGPADQAGLRRGDTVLSIGGVATADRASMSRAGALLGTGKVARVVVDRRRDDGSMTRLAFDVQPEVVQEDHAFAMMLEGGRGYVYLSQFYGNADEAVAYFVDDLVKEGARELILDLRFNGGGSLLAAERIASLFLAPGAPLVRVQDRQARRVDAAAPPWAGRHPTLPIKILLNRYSASGSEVLAGALRDHGRARLYGEESWGKGTVQRHFQLDGGALVKITTSRWQTPDGRQLEHRAGARLTPDVAAAMTDAQEKAFFLSTRRRLLRQPAESVEDPVLERALGDR